MLVALGPWSGHKEGMIKKSLSLPPEANCVLLCTTVYYCVLLCTVVYYCVLLCTTVYYCLLLCTPMCYSVLLVLCTTVYICGLRVCSLQPAAANVVYVFLVTPLLRFANPEAGGLEPSPRPQAGND